jgi:hypothetical protein
MLKVRIRKANWILEELYQFWKKKNTLMKSKARMFNGNIKSVLLYGCETRNMINQVTINYKPFLIDVC